MGIGLLSAFVALAAFGCQGDEGSGPEAGSESHFLVDCSMTCAEGFECLCGVCTERCEEDLSCQELYPTAECVALADRPAESQCPAQDGVTAFCDVRCETAAQCAGLGADFACEAGFCRQVSSSPIMPREGRIEIEELCDFYVNRVCDIKMQCFGWDYQSREQCLEAQECDGWAEFNDFLARGAIRYEAEAAYECHQRLLEDPCSLGFFLLVPELTRALAACGAATGLVPEGEVCYGDECAPGTGCYFEGSCPGICRRNENLAEGEPCITRICVEETEHCSQCAVGLVCSNEVCRPQWQLGDACASTIDCSPNLWCNVSAGECQPLAGLGEPCSDFRQQAPNCEEDLWCDGSGLAPGICRPLGGAGEPCRSDQHCLEPLSCLPTGDPLLGSCGEKRPDGAACDSYDDCQSEFCDTELCAPLPGQGESCIDRCQEGHSCQGSVCLAERFPGESCDETTYCRYSRCEGGVCTVRRRFGETCSVNDDCLSSNCIDGVCTDVVGCVP